jgi:hypothetical protein
VIHSASANISASNVVTLQTPMLIVGAQNSVFGELNICSNVFPDRNGKLLFANIKIWFLNFLFFDCVGLEALRPL